MRFAQKNTSKMDVQRRLARTMIRKQLTHHHTFLIRTEKLIRICVVDFVRQFFTFVVDEIPRTTKNTIEQDTIDILILVAADNPSIACLNQISTTADRHKTQNEQALSHGSPPFSPLLDAFYRSMSLPSTYLVYSLDSHIAISFSFRETRRISRG